MTRPVALTSDLSAYYNENDPKAAAWLRELIKVGAIAPGKVDERDVRDVRPAELDGFVQCHFFAGIGVWSYALRLAGWSDSDPVWTGSCPCQPFSAAGARGGFADERHLWPAWFHLIEERRPPIIFGEQVANKGADLWIDLVQDDLEALDYAIGAAPFPAAGIGSPHVRDRLYWMAHADGRHTGSEGLQRGWEQRQQPPDRVAIELADDSRQRCGEGGQDSRGLASGDRSQRLASGSVPSGHVNGFWGNAEWIYCRDEKYRPVEPGSFPLAHGSPVRVGRLRGYGNAVVAQQAAAFIEACRSAA